MIVCNTTRINDDHKAQACIDRYINRMPRIAFCISDLPMDRLPIDNVWMC